MAATEKVGIEIELLGGEEALALLKRIDGSIDTLNKKRKFKSLSGLKSAKGELEGYISELQKLQKEEKRWQDLAKRVGKENMSAFGVREWDKVKGKIDETNGKIKQMSAEMDEVTIKTKTFGQMFKSAASSVAHVGSAMQSLGNAMVRVTSPMRRLTTGLLMGAGYKALNLFTEGLSGSFTRADTMNKYVKLMKEYETANYTAKDSREELDASIQGLPIALDEAIGLAQRYTLSLGDMERGTKLAVATNNAFLASMATETQRYQGMLQLQDLMNGKKLQSREWMSLGSSMGKAINEIGLKLGYSRDQLGEFRQELYAGKIDTQEFLDALIAVGTGKGSLVALAKTSAETWEGLFSNAKIAVTRMGANVIDTLNKTFKKATGRTLLQQLLGIDAKGNEMGDGLKHWINGISKAVQGWIRSHPQEIMDFFNDLKAIDWKGLAQGFAEGAMWFARLVSGFAKLASGKDLSKLGRAMVKMNALGNALLVGGGFLKGTRHIWALIGAGGSWLLKGKLGGIFGALTNLFGKKKDLKTVAETAKEVPSIANTFKSAFKALQGMITVAGGIAIASGTGFVAFKSFKSMMNDLKETIDVMSEIDWDKGAGAMTAMGTFFAAFAGLGKFASMDMAAVGEILAGEVGVGLLTTVAAGIADLDMFFIKDAFKKFKEVTDYLNESVDNLRNLKEIKNIGDVKERISNVIDALQQVYASLKVQDEEGKSLMSASTQEINEMKGIVGGMESVLGSVEGINEKMLELSKVKLIRKSDAVNIGEQIGDIFEGLGEIFSGYLGTAFGENPVEQTAGMTSTLDNFNKSFTVLTGENGLFANLRRVQNDLREIPGVQTIGSTLSNIKSWLTDEGGLFDQLKDISTASNKITNAGDVQSKMGNFATAFESLRTIFKKLKAIKKLTAGYEGGDIPGMGAVRNLISQLQSAFDTNTVNQINSQISSFVEQINGLLEAVSQINAKDGKIDIQIHLTDHIYGKEKVLSDIKKIQSDVQAAVNSIKTYYSKHIAVAVSATVNTSGAVSGISSGMSGLAGNINSLVQGGVDQINRPAKGGLIYRAKGGGVGFPGRPIGTDRVPAWLTPGEYVHNKRAVSTFGIDFMRKVNNLDVKGAMDELMHRAGHMANVNRGSVVNNTYNNNQKVVINNNGNSGAGYTFKRASRFVGAL